ncbi:MAG: serine hydrolase domain-containing protein [Vicinamibacteria bacterium]
MGGGGPPLRRDPVAIICGRPLGRGATSCRRSSRPLCTAATAGPVGPAPTLERGRSRLPTSRTIYAIASITKTFTGTLLAQAAVAGRLKPDDDVRKYLDGDFPGLQFQGQPVRLFHPDASFTTPTPRPSSSAACSSGWRVPELHQLLHRPAGTAARPRHPRERIGSRLLARPLGARERGALRGRQPCRAAAVNPFSP